MGGRGASSSRVGGGAKSRGYSAGKVLTDEEYANMYYAAYNQYETGNVPDLTGRVRSIDDEKVFEANLAKFQGFDRKPAVVSDSELDSFIQKNGATELWRGVGGSEQAEQFTDGPLFLGNGIYGNGTYTVTSKNVAMANGKGKDSVARMALRPDAKVVDYSTASAGLARARAGNYGQIPNDVGIYAMGKGFDAIKVTRGAKAEYFVVLNRTAVVVSSKKYSPEK